MAESPHSSLSTPTPASLSIQRAPQTPPKPSPSPTLASQIHFSIKNSSPTPSSNALANPLPPSLSPTSSISFQPSVSVLSSSGSSSFASPPNSPHVKSTQRTPTVSPSSSRYQSPLTSPRVSHQGNGEVEDGELDDSDSSDVEIYLSSLGIDDTAPKVHVTPDSTMPEESPVISSTTAPEQTPQSVTSPQLPPAPAQPTIPLPDIGTERRLSPNADVFHYKPTSVQSTEIEATRKPDAHEDKTPNVYINGLPPHFPEDQLFALASPFGEIRSVRTFTRHVRDSESGYGFVLFETIEAAEKCITSLRRYRNLHPTFSKQVHKIPGTAYSQANIQLDHTPPESASSLAGWEQESRGDAGEDASFKAKMESLHDPTSTNLYMEGLPLSIDEPTLAALVSPHRINSSRFFQTRLSNPPRIIAFVRLETRAGAEEIIERLHGRMVRGWNDAGSRISVRFSDTAEQRELRRTERAAREGENSPSRITIAQAALLNLHGQEIRSQAAAAALQTRSPIPSLSLDHRLNRPQPEHAWFSEYSSNAHVQTPAFAVDYSLAPGRQASRTQTPTHTSPYRHHAPLPSDSRVQGMDPNMAALLDSLRGNGVPFQSASTYAGGQSVYQDHAHRVLANRGLMHAPAEMDYGIGYNQFSGVAHPRSGYTATEEFIMRAHADSNAQRRRPPPLDLLRRRRDSDASVNIGMGVRGYRAQASSVSLPQQQQQHPFSPSLTEQPLSPMNEEEFHATAARNSEYRQTLMQPTSTVPKHNHRIHPAHVNARLSRDHAPSQQQQQQQQHQQQNSPSLVPSPNPNLHHYQQAHLRSSTLPHRTSSAANQHQRHYQHSSMSIPNSNASANITSRSAHNTSNIFTNKNITINDPVDIYDTDRADTMANNLNNNHYDVGKAQRQHHNRVDREYRDHQNLNFYELDQTSPSMVSPSLTYSSHTPSTLSPATPFFGSFQVGQTDGFANANAKAEGFGRVQGFEGKKMRTGSH